MEIFGEVGAKMGPRWTQDGPSWQQVAPKMGHDGAKMAILGSVWELFGEPWGHLWSLFWRSLQKWPKCKNKQRYSTLGGFFGGYVGKWWLQDGVVLAILGDVWPSWCQGWRTRAQDAAAERSGWIFGGLEGGRGDAFYAEILGHPPLRNSRGRGWSSHLHLELPTPPGNS